MFLKMVKTCNSPWMSVSLCLARFRWKVLFYMNEMRLENSFRLTGFTYVFEHDHKFNSVLQFLYVWRRLNGKVVFVNGISFKRVFFEWLVLPMFLKMVKNAMVRGCPCSSDFLCLTRFQWTTNFFVNGVSFEKLLRMMGSTYGFENG